MATPGWHQSSLKVCHILNEASLILRYTFLVPLRITWNKYWKQQGGWGVGGGGVRVVTPGWHQSSLKVCHILNEASLILCYTSLVPLRITWNECWKKQGWGGGIIVVTLGWHQSSLKVCHILNEASLILCYTSLVPLSITWNECWKQQGGGGGGGFRVATPGWHQSSLKVCHILNEASLILCYTSLVPLRITWNECWKQQGGGGGVGFRVATPGWHQSSLKVCHILNEASLILRYTSLVPLRITRNECWKQRGVGGGSEWLRQDEINLVLKYVTF